MALIKFILIVALIYYLLRIIFRQILPSFVKKQFKKMADEANNNNGKAYKQEGTITIDHAPEKSKLPDNNLGEYVDFEDIKE